MKKLLVFLSAVSLIFGLAPAAGALTLGELTFTEVGTGFTIDGGSVGEGTESDPYIIRETVTGLDVTMSIEGLPDLDPNNPSESGHDYGFWLQKEVTNSTTAIWNFYDLELQEILYTPSANGDGLSFAQGSLSLRPWTSDKFSYVNEIVDPRDFINFSNGVVNPGETVTFNFVITDNSPVDLFYLRQRPNFRPGQVPEPATVLLLGLGIFGLAGFGRKRFKKN